MKELKGDLFNHNTYQPQRGYVPDAICITTNGFVKANGRAVMGRGCAAEALKRFPNIDKTLGSHIKTYGNKVFAASPISGPGYLLVFFPVKPISAPCAKDKSNVVKHMRKQFNPGDKVPGWACTADIEIIKRSAFELRELSRNCGWNYVVLPRPGCGAGELDWKDVKPVLDSILDNSFYSITF